VNSKLPKALAKASAKLKGGVVPAHVIEAGRRAAKRPRSAAWKQKMAEYWRNRGHPPGHRERRFWTAEEDAILGKYTDGLIALLSRRSVGAVRQRRSKIGVPPFIAG